MHVLEITDLVVRYDTVTAVNGVSMHVDGGEIVALLGPNGAGKTSIIETVEGYRQAQSGTVSVLGTPPDTGGRHLTDVGVLLQEDGVYPAARVDDVVALFRSHAGDTGPTSSEVLDTVGLSDQRRSVVRKLSGGEKRRLGLALALVGEPQLLLLDEPTSGVDHAGRATLRAAVRTARDRGCGVLLTTHELEEAERLADRLVILDRGTVVAEGTPDELTSASEEAGVRFTAESNLDLSGLAAALAAPVTEPEPGEYLVATAATPATVARIAEWMAGQQIMVGEIRAGRHRLADVFERLTRAEDRS